MRLVDQQGPCVHLTGFQTGLHISCAPSWDHSRCRLGPGKNMCLGWLSFLASHLAPAGEELGGEVRAITQPQSHPHHAL